MSPAFDYIDVAYGNHMGKAECRDANGMNPAFDYDHYDIARACFMARRKCRDARTLLRLWQRDGRIKVCERTLYRTYPFPHYDRDRVRTANSGKNGVGIEIHKIRERRMALDPAFWKEAIIEEAQTIWRRWGGAREAYEHGIRDFEDEVRRVFGANGTAESNKRQLRALGVIV